MSKKVDSASTENFALKQNSQKKRFFDAAKAAECDESEETFDEKLARLGKFKPPKPKD